MEGFKQTEIGWIPEDWEVKELQYCIDKIIGGGTPSRQVKAYWGGKIPWATVKDFSTFNSLITQEYITPLGVNNSATHIIPRGTLITSTRMGLGRVFVYDVDVAINQDLKALFVNENSSKRYIKYWFLLKQKEIEDLGTGSTVKGIRLDQLKSLKIILPKEIEEQEAIAKALSDVDSLIDTLERKIAKKRNIKQGAMQRLLTGKQRLPGFRGDWVEKKLGEIALMQSGGTPKSDNPHYYNGNIPWLVINDMTVQGKFLNSTEKKISKIGLDNSSARIFKRGTVMYAMYASLGKCSIADIDLSCNQAILGITVSDQLSNSFLYYYLCSIEEDVKNMGQTGTQSNLSKEIVQNFIIKLPSLKEQTAIAQILTDMDNEITTLEQKLNKYKQIKQGMMQELLTGKIRLI